MSNTDQYTVGWICALQTEYLAARAFLEKRHDPPEQLSPNDNNHYTLGDIRGHQVVIAVLPDGEYGTSSAACVARDMLHSFPNVRFGLMVGIGGGAPTKQDIRLGDIVVSSPQSGHGGLLQYDFGKEIQDHGFLQTGFLNQPPTILRAAVSGLQVQYEEEGHLLKESIQSVLEGNKRLRRKYAQPPLESDRLYDSQYTHIGDPQSDCATICDSSKLIRRPQRGEDEDNPAIHYGLIASGNRLMKNATFRDKLAGEQDVLCFEMEAAGLMNHFPCLAIRGVCDYADSHKNKEWQGYAAMMAAAYAKDLLYQIAPKRVSYERKASEVIREIQDQLKEVSDNVDKIHSITRESALEIGAIAQSIDLKELPVAEGAEFETYMDQHEEGCLLGTREELLREIDEWAVLPESRCIFWLNGLAGTGKSTISRTVAKSFKEQGLLGASFFFKRGEGDRGNAIRFFPTITRQLFTQIAEIQPMIMHVLKDDVRISTKPLKEQFDKLILQPLLSFKKSNTQTRTLVIMIDALDECENDNNIHVILQLLSQLKQARLVQLRVFVTSRPELPIRLGFQNEVRDDHQDFILHQIPSPIIKRDISLFLENKLAKIRTERSLQPDWPGVTKTQMLITMSVPLFIFAATIYRILLDYQWDPEDSLSEILVHQNDTSKLNGTYLPVLDRLLVGQNGRKREKLIREYRMVLGTIIFLESPLSLHTLANFLGRPESFLDTRLNSLHSVLDIPHNKMMLIRPFHLSLRDFLLNTDTREHTPLWIDEKETNQDLTTRCLHVMNQNLKKDICNLQSYGTERMTVNCQHISDHLPLELQYSCRHWTHHIAQSSDAIRRSDEILAFLNDHFLHWVEVMSLLGAISEVQRSINTLKSAMQGKEDSEIYRFLRDGERFILKNSQMVDVAPLQLYVSGLIFAPKMTTIRQTFAKDIPAWIYRCPRVEDTWGPELRTLEGHSGSVCSVAFSPDGQQLASGSYNNTVKI